MFVANPVTLSLDDPDLIHDMFNFRADFTIQLTRKVLEEIEVDFAVIAEDMAYKNGPHISPAMYREFWFPHQGRVLDMIRKCGVETISFWNSGDLRPLLPAIAEAGFNCVWPVEDVAGMNAPQLRKEWDQEFRLVGNIAKEVLMKDKETVRREVFTKVPELLASGGYLPCVDDQMPLEVPFENYVYYTELLKDLSREICG